MKSRQDLLNEARQKVREMSVRELHAYLGEGNDPALLDVRGLDEWEMGHLEGAVHLARGHLEARVESVLPDKSREVVVYCAGGVRSLLAGVALLELGYERVISVSGGVEDWEDAGYPVDRPPAPEEVEAPGSPELLKAQIEHLEQLLLKKKRQLAQMA
jgi:rhodanese-related sulfurtransferase